MRFRIDPYLVGDPDAPLRGRPIGGEYMLDAPESPQLGDVLPPVVDGCGAMTVRHRTWVHSGAGLVLLVEVTCRRVMP